MIRIKMFFITSWCFLSFLSCVRDDSITQPSTATNSVVTDLGTVSFLKTFGGTLNESGRSIISTSDGGYAVAGFVQSNDGDITDKLDDSYDYWILKFSPQGELQWNKTYGGTDNDRANSIIQTKDGGYAIIGSSFSIDGDVSGNPDNLGNDDLWVLKLDASGTIMWEKTFGYIGSDKGFSIIEALSGGYVITGILDVTASNGQGSTFLKSNNTKHAGGDIWVIRLSDSGELLWSKFYGGSFTDTPEEIIETNDGYFIAGWTDSNDFDISNNIGSYDFWIIKINNLGILQWEKNFGGSEIDELFGMVNSDDGNYVLAGSTRSADFDINENKGGADFWVLKMSSFGEIIWQKTYGGSSFDVSRAIKKTSDNGFVLVGSSRSQDGDLSLNKGQNDAWVIKIDNNGALKGGVSVGGSDIDFMYDIAQLNDGSLIAVGDTYSTDGAILQNKGLSDLLILKIK